MVYSQVRKRLFVAPSYSKPRLYICQDRLETNIGQVEKACSKSLLQEQVKAIVDYARHRGIRIVPGKAFNWMMMIVVMMIVVMIIVVMMVVMMMMMMMMMIMMMTIVMMVMPAPLLAAWQEHASSLLALLL